eukprot:1008433-Pleurochrysis_carterae.AAC.1
MGAREGMLPPLPPPPPPPRPPPPSPPPPPPLFSPPPPPLVLLRTAGTAAGEATFLSGLVVPTIGLATSLDERFGLDGLLGAWPSLPSSLSVGRNSPSSSEESSSSPTTRRAALVRLRFAASCEADLARCTAVAAAAASALATKRFLYCSTRSSLTFSSGSHVFSSLRATPARRTEKR